jgi:hypothetical protein
MPGWDGAPALLGNIDAIGPTGTWLDGMPPGKIAHFAGEARVTDAADMRKVGEDKRLTLLVSFVHTVATGVRDDAVIPGLCPGRPQAGALDHVEPLGARNTPLPRPSRSGQRRFHDRMRPSR